ncbi:MAG: TlpA disulfide reductase family protein, partial [Anaerolineales bacterium]
TPSNPLDSGKRTANLFLYGSLDKKLNVETAMVKIVLALLVFLALLALPGTAHACPVCKESLESNPELAAGYSWSVIGLVSLPFVLVSVIMVGAMRALNPAVYAELKQRVWKFLWPKGWLYLSTGAAAVALLFYVTTPPDPVTEVRLSYATLKAQPVINQRALPASLENRVVVVTFFATWCPPCVEQVTDLTRLQEEFADEGVTILGVNSFEAYASPPGVPHLHPDGTLEFHTGAPSLPNFLETNHVTIPVLDNTPTLSVAFGEITRIPATFVFDAQGRLIRRYINEAQGEFVRPQLETLRRDVRAALRCGGSPVSVIREACLALNTW